MRGLGIVLSTLLAGSALAEEAWISPREHEPAWNAVLAERMPGLSVSDCGVINSMAAQAVFVQCSWIDPDGYDVGYVTQSLFDGSLLCGWAERPEALIDDWVLDLGSGNLVSSPPSSPCPAPVRWDMVCQSESTC